MSKSLQPSSNQRRVSRANHPNHGLHIAMTAKPNPQFSKRDRLCSIENANRVATQIADLSDNDTAVVRTGNPIQPFRVVFAKSAKPDRIVSRVVTSD